MTNSALKNREWKEVNTVEQKQMGEAYVLHFCLLFSTTLIDSNDKGLHITVIRLHYNKQIRVR